MPSQILDQIDYLKYEIFKVKQDLSSDLKQAVSKIETMNKQFLYFENKVKTKIKNMIGEVEENTEHYEFKMDENNKKCDKLQASYDLLIRNFAALEEEQVEFVNRIQREYVDFFKNRLAIKTELRSHTTQLAEKLESLT